MSSELMIREMADFDKPRERLLYYGADKLTNQELLAILIATGNKNESSIALAAKVLKELPSIRELRDITYEELTTIKGIGKVKAITILAFIELAVRMHSQSREETHYIRSPEDVSNILMEKIRYYNQEHFIVLYLTTKNMVIEEKTLFIGSLNSSLVHPREIFREAVKRKLLLYVCIITGESICRSI